MHVASLRKIAACRPGDLYCRPGFSAARRSELITWPVLRIVALSKAPPCLPSRKGLNTSSMRSPGLKECLVQPPRVRLPGLVSSMDQTSGDAPGCGSRLTSKATCGLVHRNSVTVPFTVIVLEKSNMANEWGAATGNATANAASTTGARNQLLFIAIFLINGLGVDSCRLPSEAPAGTRRCPRHPCLPYNFPANIRPRRYRIFGLFAGTESARFSRAW